LEGLLSTVVVETKGEGTTVTGVVTVGPDGKTGVSGAVNTVSMAVRPGGV